MSVVLPKAVLAISIDLEVDPQRRGVNQQRALEGITGRLITLLGKYHLPATWGVADPAVSAATDRLLAAGAGHEIAILGDSTWVGRHAGRSRFARELSRRVLRGRAAGLDVSSLVLRDVQLDDHLDLVVKQDITAVRSPRDHALRPSRFSRQPAPQPHTLRFGLWNVPASQSLPGRSRWFAGGGGLGTAKRGVHRVLPSRGVYQIVVDSLELAAQGSAALRVLEKVLRHADRRRRQGVIDVMPLASIAAQLSGNYHATSARSILAA